MASDKEKIREYISDQIAQADFRAHGYVFDANNKKRLNRNIFIRLQSYLEKFLEGNRAYRWIALTGLRGAGKTTVMYQLYHSKKNIDAYFLVLSVDEVVKTLNRAYAVQIELAEEKLGELPLTSKYDQMSVDALLDAMCLTFGLDKKVEGEHIILYSPTP